jgi:hypothetical protein
MIGLLALSAALICAGTSAAKTRESGAMWLPYWVGPDDPLPTYGTSIAVDARGGIHAAYSIYSGVNWESRSAIYAYCPTNFSDRANWTFVRIGEAVQDVRLALDPEGRPRLMLFGPTGHPDRMRYQYAECNAGWTNAENWKITTVATPLETTAMREYDSNRYFAISRQGTVAFVYTDTPDIENPHRGAFYMSCASGCTDLRNWTDTRITASYIMNPALAFSPDGHPRLAFGIFLDTDLYLAYAQCDGDSSDPAQWSALVLTRMHGTATYSLQSDRNGRPRLAFSSGSYAAAPFTDHQLFYLWSMAGDVTDPGNWHFNNVGLYMTSGGVDLALDAQDRPRLSFLVGAGLGYGWCDRDAETPNPVWEYRIVESNAALASDYEVLPIMKCTVSAWINGQRSSLALDPMGHPRFGYDAEHIWSGVYVDKPWQSCYSKDITMARLAFVTLTPSLAIRRSGEKIEIVFDNGTLESAPAVHGPWSVVPAAASPFALAFDGAHQFYRVRR